MQQSPIRQAMRGRFSSYDHLATQVLDAWRDREPDANLPAARSLGAKIGLIDKGEVVWWTRRPHAISALAEVLNVSPEDVGLHTESGPQFIATSEFPELPPFDPGREEAPILAIPRSRDGKDSGPEDLDVWLADLPRGLRNPPMSMHWMTMPAGTGRRFLVARLIARGVEVHRVRTLADAADRLSRQAPFVVAPEQSGHAGDLEELAKRPKGCGLLVLAAHAPPTAPPEFAFGEMGISWELRNATRGQRLVAENLFLWNGLQVWSWILVQDWRERLVRWVEKRFERFGVDTLFSAEGVLAWLNRFDPETRWLRTPGDLLPLCRMAHRVGERRLPDPVSERVADEWVREIVRGAAEPRSVHGPWLDQHGIDAFKSLARRRWRNAELSWTSGLPCDVWERLSGQVGHGSEATSALLAVARAASIEEREALAVRFAEKQIDLVPLRAAGLLQRRADDLDDLHPRWVADLVVRDSLLEAAIDGAPETWAITCFDPERRPFLDAALDAVPLPVFESLAKSFKDRRTWDMATLAAEEAIFVAIGRRLARDQMADVAALAGLAYRVLERVAVAPEGQLPTLWTRPRAGSDDETIDWVAACWAWSLHLPRAGTTLRSDMVWLMPGLVADLPAYPVWLFNLLPNRVAEHFSRPDELETSAQRRLLDVTYSLFMGRLPPPSAPPMWCHPALLAAAAQGKFSPSPFWWEGVAGQEAASIELVRHLNCLLPDEGVLAARRLWPVLVRWNRERGKRMGLIQASSSSTWRWLCDRLDEDTVVDPLDAMDCVSVADDLVQLPPNLRSALVERIATMTHFHNADGLSKLVKGAGSSIAPVLPVWLGFEETRDLAADLLWRWTPDRTKALLNSPDQTHAARRALVLRSPFKFIGEMIPFAEDVFTPSEVAQWVHLRLPSSGTHGPALLQFLARAHDARSADVTG
jgi:hypothetical protein